MHSTARAEQNSAIKLQPKNSRYPGYALKGEATEPREGADKHLVILDNRVLDRDCLAECLVAHGLNMGVMALETIGEWRARDDLDARPSAILLNLAGRKVTEPAVSNEINSLAAEFHPVPVVVLADSDELVQILKALECGAKGYIPSSIGIAVCVEAINLAVAGGTFVPANSVMTMRKVIGEGGEATGSLASMFTQRQEEVIRELRRGKANKIIAYELNLRESTVKVHIRNIMKKLKATNRTEVAYKLSEMFPG
jgi:DNA-binding NarL/FixJ family response regulator